MVGCLALYFPPFSRSEIFLLQEQQSLEVIFVQIWEKWKKQQKVMQYLNLFIRPARIFFSNIAYNQLPWDWNQRGSIQIVLFHIFSSIKHVNTWNHCSIFYNFLIKLHSALCQSVSYGISMILQHPKAEHIHVPKPTWVKVFVKLDLIKTNSFSKNFPLFNLLAIPNQITRCVFTQPNTNIYICCSEIVAVHLKCIVFLLLELPWVALIMLQCFGAAPYGPMALGWVKNSIG